MTESMRTDILIDMHKSASYGDAKVESGEGWFTIMIPRHAFPQPEDFDDQPQPPKTLHDLMLEMPKEWRYRWCIGPSHGGCSCLGCVNVAGWLGQLGYGMQDWKAWVAKYPEGTELPDPPKWVWWGVHPEAHGPRYLKRDLPWMQP